MNRDQVQQLIEQMNLAVRDIRDVPYDQLFDLGRTAESLASFAIGEKHERDEESPSSDFA